MKTYLWYFILIYLALTTLLPYTQPEGTARFEGYTYSSQAALLSTQNTLFPSNPDVQREFEFFEHPLLFKWIQAGVFKCFGISEFNSKLLVILMSSALILFLFWFGATYFSPWIGFMAGFFLLISPRYMIHSSLCVLDIPLIFFTTSSILLAIHASYSSSDAGKSVYLLSGLCIGAAMLTKGAFGLVPVPVIFFHLMISKKWKDLFHPFFILGALAPYGCIALYNDLLSIHHPEITLRSFWRTQGNAPVNDVLYYFKALLKRYFYLLIPAMGWLFWVPGTRGARHPQRQILFTLLFWMACVLFALTWVKSKKQGYYLLPLNPAFSLVAAFGLAQILKEKYRHLIPNVMLASAMAMSFVFATTPLTLHKYKLLQEVNYWKQFGLLEWKLKKLLSENQVIYYTPGYHYVLNFKFPKEFAQRQILPLIQLNASKTENKDYSILADKTFKIDIPNLYIIDETENLYLLSDNP